MPPRLLRICWRLAVALIAGPALALGCELPSPEDGATGCYVNPSLPLCAGAGAGAAGADGGNGEGGGRPGDAGGDAAADGPDSG